MCWLRDTGYPGPNHDEVITLLASQGLENEFERLKQAGTHPFHEIVPASEWQRFTRGFVPKPFATIRDDVESQDIHPPLAFWVFNRWLALFRDGSYQQATLLTVFQILMAAGLLGLIVLRCTQSAWLGTGAACLFLAGNAAVVTAIFVRQYALLAFCYAAVIFLATEISRRNINVARFALAATAMGTVALCGMLTQYAFATVSIPVHIALLILLVWRRSWSRVCLLAASYLLAGMAFQMLSPGGVAAVSTASRGFEREAHWHEAIAAIPQVLIPWPAFLPLWFSELLGGVLLLAVLGMALYLFCARTSEQDPSTIRILLSGILGAGIVQVLMVGTGRFPRWATGPSYLCSFWLLSVLAIAILMHRQKSRSFVPGALAVMLISLLSAQFLFAWHCHQTKIHTAPHCISRFGPDLVILDDLARGNILQMTAVMNPAQRVLATDTDQILMRLKAGELRTFNRLLYIPVQDGDRPRAQLIARAFRSAGWLAEQQPVTHPGFQDVWVIAADLPGRRTSSK